jgi:hypothetical protein
MSQRKFTRAHQKAGTANRQEIKETAQQQPMVQAMVWYRQEHWQALRDMFADTHLLPLTYEDWLQRAESKKTEIQAAGDRVIKVYIDPETFPQWCRDKGLTMDAEARARLAIEVAQAQSFTL